MSHAALGRHLFGAAVFASGVVSLVWHAGPAYLAALAVLQAGGGIAMQFRPAARAGAAAVGIAYLIRALLCIPQIVSAPGLYATWGAFFYPFANAIGAAALYALMRSSRPSNALLRTACVLFGLCNISYAIEQVEFLARTASLVPAWLPPNQQFWAVITAAPFALAGIALIIDRVAVLAARLLSAMLWAFGVLVWIPATYANPHLHSNWTEGTETVAIGAAAWILADLIVNNRDERSTSLSSRIRA